MPFSKGLRSNETEYAKIYRLGTTKRLITLLKMVLARAAKLNTLIYLGSY